MAYVVEGSSISKDDSGTGSVVTCPISKRAVENDVAVVVLTRVNGVAATAPSGWETIVLEDSKLSIFYKNQGVTPDTTVSIPTTATTCEVTSFLLRGCNTSTATSAYDAGSYSSVLGSTAIQITGPVITPTNTNSTIIHGSSESSGQTMIPAHGGKYIGGIYGGAANHLLVEDFKPAATATNGYLWHRNHTGTTSIDAVFSFAMVDSGSALVKGYLDWSTNPPATPIHFMGLNGESGIDALDAEQYDPTLVIPNITDGNGSPVSTIYDAFGSSSDLMQGGVYSAQTNSTSAAASLSGTTLTTVPALTGKNICFSIKARMTSGISPYNEVGAYFILSDKTNSRVWMYGGSDTTPNIQEGVYPTIIDPDGGFEWEDIGTVTLSSCDTLVLGYNKPTTQNETFYYSPVVLLESLVLSGGASVLPASMSDLRQIVQLNRLNTVLNQGGQTDGQFICFQDIEIATNYWNGSAQAVSFPQAYNEAAGKVQAQIADSSLSFLFNVPDGATVIDKNKVYDMGSFHSIGFKSTTSTDVTTTYDVTGATWLSCTPYLNAINGSLGGLLIADSKEAVYTTLASCTGGVTFSGCVDAQAITITSKEDFAKLANCTFKSNTVGIKITGDQAGSWDDPNLTVSGNTFDIEYSGTTDFSIQSANALTVNNTGTGTLTTITPTFDLVVNSSQTASQINVFTTATQTIIATESSNTQLTYTHSSETVDITVLKDGYIPFRQTGVVLSGTVTIDVQLVKSREYLSTHGLTYTTDASWATNQLTVPAWGVTGQQVFSLIMEAFKSETALRNTAFNLQMDGANSLYLVNDAEGASDASIENLIECGVAYINTAGTTTASWVGVKSVGTATGFTGEYQQVDGSGTTDARATGAFNEVVKMYGDITHGNFDYTGHLVLKYQPNGYREKRADVLDAYGISALSPTLYIVAMQPVAISAAVGDPVITLTVTDHGATPVTWNSKNFSITITADAADSGEDILRELNYNLSLDATYNGKDPFNWPEMVLEAGSAYETARGITEGGVGAALKGVRVVDGVGNPHPAFTRMQADDGTYYVVPVTANVAITGIEAGSRLRIYNETTLTETYNDVVAGTSYSDSYTDGTTYSDGDVVTIYLAYQSGATAKLGYTASAVASTSGWSIIASQLDDTVYNTNGIDGSLITKFTADYVNDEIDVTTASNFTGPEVYAFYVAALMTADGLTNSFGGFTALDEGNYRNNSTVVSMNLDNTTTTEVWQTDTSRLFRSDGVRPIRNPTSGGGGIDINWQNVVYVVTAGSGLTAGQAAELTTAASVKAKTDQLTFSKANELDINVKSVSDTTISGSGTAIDPWGP